ncbi:hypothetical protein HHJ81_01745 [Mobiluncus mulieris]|uniref:hypothetical protein n=1 Tax=Mobiluncus mulieris TaxID=2052 RepID=UPI0014706C22|nr:hypothetical protein [Mobiluncus mulieris]NMW59834.1 hypothetical protein [Mobiluncus mulieris]
METSGKISGKTLGAEIAEISQAEIFPGTGKSEIPAGSSLSQGVAFPTTLGYN